MQTANTLSHAAKMAIAFGVQDLRGIRAMAATVLSRWAMEYARDGYLPDSTGRNAHRIAQRFRLGDYFGAVYKAYGDDFAAERATELAQR